MQWREPSSQYPELAPRKERPPDDEIFDAVWGAFGTSYEWWEEGEVTNIDSKINASDGWTMAVRLGVEDEGEIIEGVLNADNIWRAITMIAALEVSATAECTTNCLRARNSMLDYGGSNIVFDTVAWDRVDFDQISSDEVMQVAIAGKVIWG
jgi:hypothetical protein